ncbi:MAG: hypothetical protein ACK417_08735 [Bacteroidia bacterium]
MLKTLRYWLLGLVAVMTMKSAQAQIIVTLGTGTTTNTTTTYPSPYGNWYYGARHQFMVRASELQAIGAAPGFMTSLGFNVQTVQAVPLQNFSISILATTDSVLSTANFATGLTQVYSVASYTETTGWNTHPFNNNFFWNGSDHLIIEVCFNNNNFTNNAVVFNTNVGFTSSMWYEDDALNVCTNTQPWISTSQSRPNMQLGFLPNTGRDLGTNALISPVPLQSGINQVSARYMSLAADPIFSADLGYQLGNDPPVLLNNFNFTLPLGPGQSEVVTFPTLLNIPAPGTYALKVWATNANGLGNDNNTTNDTLSFSLCTGISGVFSIGGVGADYTTIQDAVNAINNCGISGPVTFNINPGTYTGTYIINNIPGGTAGNSITFTSSTGMASDVTLIHDMAGTATNRSHFVINGNTRVGFQNLTFQRNTAPSASGQGILAYSSPNAQGEAIGCVFVDNTTSSSSFNVGVFYRGEAGIFINNQFNGFYYPIQLEGNPGLNLPMGNQVITNFFTNYRYRAIYATNQSSLVVVGNDISGFSGTSTAGAGIWVTNAYNMDVSSNMIHGGISLIGMIFSNLNADTLDATTNTNKIYNNVINGTQASSITSSTGVPYGISLTASYVASANDNPRDAVEIANNTIVMQVNSTSTSTLQAGIYVTGGTTANPSMAYLTIRNNHLEVNPITGSLPPNFRLVRFTQTSLLDSTIINHNNYRMGGQNVPNFFRMNLGTLEYPTLADWQTATSQDLNSVSMDPAFQSPLLLIPSNNQFDNLGVAISFVQNDILGTPRGQVPDIGAYEFAGLPFSNIAHVPLPDTMLSANRLAFATITDTANSLISGSARLFYRKPAQSVWAIDSLPVVSGSTYQFNLDYSLIGGVSLMDTVEYYLAVANAAGIVTTSPLGGEGLYASNAVPPAFPHSFRIFPGIVGTYRVGSSGPADFPTLTAAVNFINAGLLVGPAEFVLIDANYSTAETFPLTISRTNGASASRSITIRLDSAVSTSIIQGSASPALLVLDGVGHLTIDGANRVTGNRALTIRNNNTATNTAAVYLRSTLNASVDTFTLQNTIIVGGSNTVTSSFGFVAGGATITTTTQADGLKGLYLLNNEFQRAYFALYTRSTVAVPSENVQIRNNRIGSNTVGMHIGFKGIDVHNAINPQIVDNHISDITGTNSVVRAGIELGGSSTVDAVVERNRIHDVHTAATNAANGVLVLAGNNALIVNNLIYGIRSQNGSATSQTTNASGIRLSGGNGHRIYYNSIHLYDNYTNSSTVGAASAALNITSTVVSNLDVRNNIFSNEMSSVSTGTLAFVAVWLVNNFNWTGTIFDNNAYQVANTANHYFGRQGTTATGPFYDQLPDWRGVSASINPNNDQFSMPQLGKIPAPFTSNTNLRIPTGTLTGIESGGVVITALGTPNTDFDQLSRPQGSGTAPDMGAYEFDGVLVADPFPPVIDSVVVTPSANQCSPTVRTVQVFARDNMGGSGIDSVMLQYTVNQVAQPVVLLSRVSGSSLQGVWSGSLPAAPSGVVLEAEVVARDSAGNFSAFQQLGQFTDDYLAVDAGSDTTIQIGGTATLVASSAGFAGSNYLEASRLGGNSQSGVTFNVRAINAIIIDTIYLQLLGTIGNTATVNVFYNTTAINGQPNISTAAGWIQVANAQPAIIQATGSTGGGALTPVALQTPVLIPAGATYGFHAGSSVSMAYTTHTAANQDTFTDGRIVIYTGPNVGYGGAAPSPSFHPRQFNGAVVYRSNANIYWTVQGNPTVVGTGDTLIVSPLATTTYEATITDSICFKSDDVTVIVSASSDVGVSEILSPTVVSAIGQPYQVKVVIRNFGNQIAASFDVGFSVNQGTAINTNTIARSIAPGDTIHHIFTQSWTPVAGGDLRLCAYTRWTADLNANNDSSCVLYQAVKVQEQPSMITRVYPNPTSQFVWFDIDAEHRGGRLEVRDAAGKLVASRILAAEERYELNVEAWAAGMYTYAYVGEKSIHRGQFVVKR